MYKLLLLDCRMSQRMGGSSLGWVVSPSRVADLSSGDVSALALRKLRNKPDLLLTRRVKCNMHFNKLQSFLQCHNMSGYVSTTCSPGLMNRSTKAKHCESLGKSDHVALQWNLLLEVNEPASCQKWSCANTEMHNISCKTHLQHIQA